MARILVLDDDEALIKLLVRWLSLAGHEAEGAGDGGGGLHLLSKGPFDLVITDIVMPNKEGLETIPEIRKRHPDLPIIAISGGGVSLPGLYLNLAQRLGATCALQKPFERETLLKTVSKCLP